jgi:hypothetical protein
MSKLPEHLWPSLLLSFVAQNLGECVSNFTVPRIWNAHPIRLSIFKPPPKPQPDSSAKYTDNATLSLDLSCLAPGVYFIALGSSHEKIKVVKK